MYVLGLYNLTPQERSQQLALRWVQFEVDGCHECSWMTLYALCGGWGGGGDKCAICPLLSLPLPISKKQCDGGGIQHGDWKAFWVEIFPYMCTKSPT